MSTQLNRAISAATQAHEGQIDRDGLPHIMHSWRVMEAVRPHGSSMMAVAILHDVLEDCEDGHSWVRAVGLTAEQLITLTALTHDKEHATYAEYIDDLNVHEDARIIKIADLHDNLSVARQRHLSEEQRLFSTKRYYRALDKLTQGDS